MARQFKHSDRTEDFRRRAVEALRNRGKKTTQEIADELAVPRSQIYKWQAEFGLENQRGQTSRELERLRAARDELAMETAALRKTIVLLGSKR